MAKAKIKIDMKQINKFRFWIGLGVLALLLIVLSYFQLTAIGGEKEKKAYAEKLKSVKGLNDFKNGNFLPPWNAREQKLKTQRDEIWNKAWIPQKTCKLGSKGMTSGKKSLMPSRVNLSGLSLILISLKNFP